jgi:polyhydroxybutyrate depolymerase
MTRLGRSTAALVLAAAFAVTGCANEPLSTSLPSHVGALQSPAVTEAGSPSPAVSPSPTGATGTDVPGAIESGGLQRTYLLHLPPPSTRLEPTPIVVALHGWPMTAEHMSEVTHLAAVADAHGFAVVFPQGYQDSWAVPGGLPTPANEAGIDDVAFIRSLLDSIGPEHGLDLSRVVATGISNGGHLVQTLGCKLSDRLIGIVPVAAPFPVGSPAECQPSRPLSVLEIVGTDDQERATFPSTLTFWAGIDKCPHRPVSGSLPDIAHDGTTVTTETSTGCQRGTEVTGYLVIGGGHAWPGGESVERGSVVTGQFDASELIWTFLSRHL